MQAEEESFTLESDSNTKYSVWVSFCEIYNETIHDLLEVLPSGPLKRTALRLSQDVKGNTFVKGEANGPWVHLCFLAQHDASENNSEKKMVALCLWVSIFCVLTDLKWIQVNSAEEAYRVLKIGRKNQSFSSTKLNNVSSRRYHLFKIKDNTACSIIININFLAF